MSSINKENIRGDNTYSLQHNKKKSEKVLQCRIHDLTFEYTFFTILTIFRLTPIL